MGSMRTDVRTSCSVALAITVASLAGCGASSSGDRRFRSAFVVQESGIVRTGLALNATLQKASHTPRRRLIKQLRPIAAGGDQAVSALETLRPPTDVAGDFNALRSALARATTDLHAWAAALSGRDPAGASSAMQALVSDSATVKATRSTLDRKLGIAAG